MCIGLWLIVFEAILRSNESRRKQAENVLDAA
jgi:hypothetical protein